MGKKSSVVRMTYYPAFNMCSDLYFAMQNLAKEQNDESWRQILKETKLFAEKQKWVQKVKSLISGKSLVAFNTLDDYLIMRDLIYCFMMCAKLHSKHKSVTVEQFETVQEAVHAVKHGYYTGNKVDHIDLENKGINYL